MGGHFLALGSDTIAIGGVTGMVVTAFIAALRLLSTGTDRVDASAEARVTALLSELGRSRADRDADRARWELERAQLQARIAQLEEDR